MFLIKKYQEHINIEWCNKTRVVKYLFKYVTKGKDRSRIVFETIKGKKVTCSRDKGKENEQPYNQNIKEINEIKEYLDCRHLVPHETNWRLFEFPLHCKMPSVERLDIHLPGMNNITYKSKTSLENITSNAEMFTKTMLTEWFVANQQDIEAHELTYVDFPSRWTWDGKNAIWKKKKNIGDKIGRIYYVHPSSGEHFYLRMLLMIVKGACSFEDLRTYTGITYDTFKEACSARGLLGDDREWYAAFEEALIWATSSQLRHLFVTMILFCNIENERLFYNKFVAHLSDDIQHKFRLVLNNPSFNPPPDQLQDMLIDELNEVFLRNGSSIANFNLPQTRSNSDGNQINRLIQDERSYDSAQLKATSAALSSKLNIDQRKAYDEIIGCVMDEKPGFFFLSGHGGTGKTFVWNSKLSYLRSMGKIVLVVASSGVVSLLLQGGRTAHS